MRGYAWAMVWGVGSYMTYLYFAILSSSSILLANIYFYHQIKYLYFLFNFQLSNTSITHFGSVYNNIFDEATSCLVGMCQLAPWVPYLVGTSINSLEYPLAYGSRDKKK